MHEVSRLCDEIVIIAEGQVVAQGVPDAIRESAGEENLEDAFVILSERAARL
jgi:sodium transport system ATP-binding protein